MRWLRVCYGLMVVGSLGSVNGSYAGREISMLSVSAMVSAVCRVGASPGTTVKADDNTAPSAVSTQESATLSFACTPDAAYSLTLNGEKVNNSVASDTQAEGVYVHSVTVYVSTAKGYTVQENTVTVIY